MSAIWRVLQVAFAALAATAAALLIAFNAARFHGLGEPSQLMIVAQTLGSGVFLAIAALLALRSPGAMTLCLVAYGAGLSAQYYKVAAFAPLWVPEMARFMHAAFGAFMPYALLIFACVFPNGRPKGWLASCVTAALILGGINVGLTLYGASDVAYGLHRALQVVVPIVIGAALATTYLAAAPALRQRVKWLIAAALLTEAVYLVHAYWSSYGAELTAMAIPALFAAVIGYVGVRRNVMDIRLALSRSLILGLLIAFLVAAFVAIEWFVAPHVRNESVALALNGCAALLVAFIFAWSMAHLEQAVDAIFFPGRLTAERQLRDEGEALQSVETEQALCSRIADAPLRVLDLTSAAVFTVEANDIHVATAIGLKESAISDRIHRYAVLSLMRSTRRTVSIPGSMWAAGDDLDLPVAAMPLMVGRRLKAFAVYGAHRSGEDIDDAERRNLDVFARAVAPVYEHLEIEALRVQKLLAAGRDRE